MLSPYQDAWPQFFAAESAFIRNALAPWLDDPGGDVQHIGSTSVPGLAAKPTIDMLAGIRSVDGLTECSTILEGLGYHRRHHLETSQHRRYCFKGNSARVSYALHVMQRNDPLWKSLVDLRDALRANAQLKDEYAALKHHCASQFMGDVRAYTHAKGPFIRSVLGMAAESGPTSRPGEI